ncbi:hypothetical protein DSM106972_016150 [Dulcicalothrix desertica PCC 7102]|uniref:Transposase n=1 Tax=Dulcicalothrix desertica PCC 7102 TaxID=232991 RepID=A0A3S1AST0_9CYAN|nr:transposase [Dulcicalothrix desertica]RUT08447.1 hypothetical protein DSM106972_016150 [Dulcicalothrix desertica PCC 7102]TWH40311.1 hypothetical protein CAL7102_09619 [Dulcicalothrix desertica PCC 7102]
MTIELKVLGVDVSKSSVTTHLMDCYPTGGLRSYWEKTRNKSSILYPTFFSNPDARKKQKSAYDFADYLKEIKPDVAVIEPTGNHYSRIWASILTALGIKTLWVGHIELRRYRGSKHLPNKSDPADALAMAAYPHDTDHKHENGELNMRYFLIHRPEYIDRIRELCQQLEHLNRVQSPIINYARQLLAWQFPEVAHRKSVSTRPGAAPPLWSWLAQRSDIAPASKTRLKNLYEKSIAVTYGIKIDSTLRQHAEWLCDVSLNEQAIEAELMTLVCLDEFKLYNKVFDKFGFGLRVRARLLSRIYPFEAFLTNGKQLIEYEVKEVKKVEKARVNGKTVVKRSPGDTKRVKRNRSRDAFKMRLGMGTVLEQSGDELVEKNSGSALCRMSLWQYVLCQVETGRLPINNVTEKLLDASLKLKNITTEQGKKLLNGKHMQSKLMSKVIHLLFQELLHEHSNAQIIEPNQETNVSTQTT